MFIDWIKFHGTYEDKQYCVGGNDVTLLEVLPLNEGWFIPLDCMSGSAEDNFSKMVSITKHGGMVDILARVDGEEYRWECDGLKYAEFISQNQSDEWLMILTILANCAETILSMESPIIDTDLIRRTLVRAKEITKPVIKPEGE